MRGAVDVLKALLLLLLSPVLAAGSLAALALSDLAWRFFGRVSDPLEKAPNTTSASVVIPNWNGRDLLAQYLSSVVLAMSHSAQNEVIVVDNGSTDGSVEFLRQNFPQVKIIALAENLGFGGGSNAGFRAAQNDIVVLLNNDMRVAPDFLPPLLAAFTDEKVFSAACQIFFSDPARVREETGLTQIWWRNGGLRVRHRVDEHITDLFPCAYGGGGSGAFDRKKFLELGGFDRLLHPFYLEDTDLGYLAWKRGWKVLYQPASHVWHEHRGTIGRRFSPGYIDTVIKKNFLLFTWKNIHEWRRLSAHFFFAWLGAIVSLLVGDAAQRPNLSAWAKAFVQVPGACSARWRARSLAVINDTEALRRPLGGYFRDRFVASPPVPDRLRVLFVSPYAICPPVHGGAVFMHQTLRHLTGLVDVHLFVLLDYEDERQAHEILAAQCASSEFLVRTVARQKAAASIAPHAVDEFSSEEIEWTIHRLVYTRRIDVLQLEYLPLGQYAGDYRRLASVLFEHDLYFQSVGRGLRQRQNLLRFGMAGFEYLRALRYELRLLPKLDRVQVCSAENRDYLVSFRPDIKNRVDDDIRAGIDVTQYRCSNGRREPYTMLFLGSFRHAPNRQALDWFVERSLRHVLAGRPEAKLIVIGSDPPARHAFPNYVNAIELRGFVEDIEEPLRDCAVFLCPILTGSGVRVKLLEAFASGIPSVSTRLGAEGIARKDGEFCALADSPEEFAKKILHLFDHPDEAAAMAARARVEVERTWDMAMRTRRLVASYRELLEVKRGEVG